MHSEEDERDSAANSLKGIAQALYSPTTAADPKDALVKLHEYKPQFDSSIESERKYFELHNEWTELDGYGFGENAPRITEEWYDELKQLHADISTSQHDLTELESKQDVLREEK